MTITECRVLISQNRNLKGTTINYNGSGYQVLDVIAVPADEHMQMYLIDYNTYKDYERAISKYLTHKTLKVALYCQSSGNPNKTVILLEDIK